MTAYGRADFQIAHWTEPGEFFGLPVSLVIVDRQTQTEAFVYRPFLLSLILYLIFLGFPLLTNCQQADPLKIDKKRPRDQSTNLQGHRGAARRLPRAGEITDPGNRLDPIELNNQASNLAAEGKLNEAAEKLEAVIRLAPDLAGAHINLSIIYERLGRLENSLTSAQTAANLAPDKPRAFRQLCGVLFIQKRFQPASECFRRLIALVPDDARAQTNLGTALHQAGRSDEAFEVLQNLVRTTPLQARAHNTIGHILFSKKKYKDAAKAFKQAVEIEPASSLYRYNLGISRLMNQNKPGALSQYRELQKLDPERARMLYQSIFRDKVVYVGKEHQTKTGP